MHAAHVPTVVVAQVTPASVKPSAGQLAATPSQCSGRSQLEVAERQVRLAPKSPQVPSMEAPWAVLQAWQVPLQAWLQQTPLAQNLELHSVAEPHEVPLVFFAEQ